MKTAEILAQHVISTGPRRIGLRRRVVRSRASIPRRAERASVALVRRTRLDLWAGDSWRRRESRGGSPPRDKNEKREEGRRRKKRRTSGGYPGGSRGTGAYVSDDASSARRMLHVVARQQRHGVCMAVTRRFHVGPQDAARGRAAIAATRRFHVGPQGAVRSAAAARRCSKRGDRAEARGHLTDDTSPSSFWPGPAR